MKFMLEPCRLLPLPERKGKTFGRFTLQGNELFGPKTKPVEMSVKKGAAPISISVITSVCMEAYNSDHFAIFLWLTQRQNVGTS